MGKLVTMAFVVLLAGCGEVTAAGPPLDGGAPGGAGAGGGAVGGGAGDRSPGGSSGGQAGMPAPDGAAGTTGIAGAAARGGVGGWGGMPQDGGLPPVPCPPSDAGCPTGTACVLLASGQGLCECPDYPNAAYCSAGCTDLKTDRDNCGTCRRACGQGQVCQFGTCQ